MRLTFKLMSAILLVIAVLMTIHSYLVVEREIDLFQEDMKRRAYLLGTVLTSSARDIWRTSGPERVFEILNDANLAEDVLHVRWVWFGDNVDPKFAPRAKIADLTPLKEGKEVLISGQSYNDVDYFHAYFPVPVDSTRIGAIELSQPLAPMYDYIVTTVIRGIVLFIAIIIIGGALLWWLGIAMVGRPVRAMAEQARRVGEGDLEARTSLKKHKDELSELSQGLNQMVSHLRESREKLQSETALRIETMEQLHHAERLATVGKLASGLAHELGTPLNVVSGRAKLIATADLDHAETVDSATVIKEQSDRMTKIIRQLLDFARSRRPEKREANLAEVVEKVVAVLKPIAEEQEIQLIRENPEEPIVLEVDPGQIQQVLTNLIMNAFHAMPDGGKVRVAVNRDRVKPPADHGGDEDLYACIRVMDEGTGISKENLSRIFEPFFSTKSVGEGTGLGLSIAHGMIKEHGGWLGVESVEGEGSTFTIYLPLGAKQ